MISKGLEEINPNDYYKPSNNVWSEYMKEFRKSLGMSQSQFAEYFKISVRSIQEWEQGRTNPPYYLLDLLKRLWIAENGTNQ